MCYKRAMNLDLTQLPDDARLSKDDVVGLLDLVEQKYQEKILYLEERLRLLQNELFGRKSEKRTVQDNRQLPLFITEKDSAPQAPPEKQTIVIAEHSRKKSGRKPLPEDLPRIEIIHDLSEEEKLCQCGAPLSRIGSDTCEKLDYVPAKIQVLRHIRYKYACKSCQGIEADGPTVKIAAAPPALIPKSMASEGLLAHIIVSKFADALPLYRQQKMFERLGIELPRATMANWAVAVAERCAPLIDCLQEQIIAGPVINIDESPLQVLNEANRANTTKSYMWVFCGGQPEHPAIVYRYHPTRSGQVALSFLDRYQGYIQSDAFSGYDQLDQKKTIIHLGCWAHVRRKFVEVVKTRQKLRGQAISRKGLADEALDYIGQLYLIEKTAKVEQLSFDQICHLRQKESQAVLTSFKQWLDEKQTITPPQGLLGKAISYALSNWSRLIGYIEDGRLKPDNNVAENAIRPFVLGRKNWIFAGHPNGAAASATFFSLIETAKKNNLEPYSYLRYLFEKIALIKTPEQYQSLLPQNVDRDAVNPLRP